MTCGPFVDGIPALAPGGKRELIWGTFEALSKVIGDRQIKVKCHFKRAAGLFEFSERECEPVECVLDVRSYFLQDAVDSDGARAAAKELFWLNAKIDDLTNGTNAIQVKVIQQ